GAHHLQVQVKVEEEEAMEQQAHRVGERVEKFCAACGEERGHVVALVTKRGHISRVSCPQCGTRSTFKSGDGATAHAPAKPGAPSRAGASNWSAWSGNMPRPSSSRCGHESAEVSTRGAGRLTGRREAPPGVESQSFRRRCG